MSESLTNLQTQSTVERPEQCVKSVQPKRHKLPRSGIFTVNYEQISQIALVFSLLILNK